MIHVLAGSADDTDDLLEAAKSREYLPWRVPKKSHANDPAIVFVWGLGFVARCFIASEPQRRMRPAVYFSEIRDIAPLASVVPIPFLQRNLPTWKWLRAYTKRYTTIHDLVIEKRLNKLLHEYQSSFAEPLTEGTPKAAAITVYERNPLARQQCIANYGSHCHVCGFSFGVAYGETAEGFIHVHHLEPVSIGRKERAVDPIKDLRPICPNCHAVVHLQSPPLSIVELKRMLKQARIPALK